MAKMDIWSIVLVVAVLIIFVLFILPQLTSIGGTGGGGGTGYTGGTIRSMGEFTSPIIAGGSVPVKLTSPSTTDYIPAKTSGTGATLTETAPESNLIHIPSLEGSDFSRATSGAYGGLTFFGKEYATPEVTNQAEKAGYQYSEAYKGYFAPTTAGGQIIAANRESIQTIKDVVGRGKQPEISLAAKTELVPARTGEKSFWDWITGK